MFYKRRQCIYQMMRIVPRPHPSIAVKALYKSLQECTNRNTIVNGLTQDAPLLFVEQFGVGQVLCLLFFLHHHLQLGSSLYCMVVETLRQATLMNYLSVSIHLCVYQRIYSSMCASAYLFIYVCNLFIYYLSSVDVHSLPGADRWRGSLGTQPW